MNTVNKENLYLSIINNLCDGVYFVDLDRTITFWNHAAEEITGYRADEIIGKKCESNLLSHIDKEGHPLCIVGCPLYETLIDAKQRKDEVFLRHKEGYRVPVLVNIFPMMEDGEIVGAIEIFTPNSSVVYEDDLVENLSNMAMEDALTRLPNRRYIESFLEYKLNEYRRFNKLFAVAMLDLDNFRAFNNTYGHDCGDQVLINVAATIKNSMRESDLFGRWGGEEFVGVFPVQRSADLEVVGTKICALVANTLVQHGDLQLSVTASVGAALVQIDDNTDTIVKRADKLMYQSKMNGKNRVTYG